MLKCHKFGLQKNQHHPIYASRFAASFATLCIESGVDIPTVSRWLGHKDGGALAMKVYGHLRDQHSVNMAQKVTFMKPVTRDGDEKQIKKSTSVDKERH